MPKLLAQNEIKLEWADIQNRVVKKRPKSASKRSTGVHLSGVIQYCLDLSKDTDEDEMPLCVAIGMAWEDWAVGLWPEMKWQPGEQQKDRIYGSPDGITKGIAGVWLEEFKATWRSRRTYGKDITQDTKWMWQLCGYCCMMDLELARLHVLWVCGDYKLGPPQPSYCTYLVEFTKEEKDRFWKNVILVNRDKALPETH